MSRLLSTAEIIDRALRKIGQFPTRSSGARADDVDETRYWLDMIVGHQSARQRCWWLVPATATFNLVAGQEAYDLAAALGGTQAPNGVEFVIAVVLYNRTTGTDIHEVPIARRTEWELRRFPNRDRSPDASPWEWSEARDPTVGADVAGQPSLCHVTRDQAPTIHFAPVPDANTDYGVRVVFQSYSPDFTRAAADERILNLRTTWNLWLVTALAYEIGNGPVRKLPADEVRGMKQDAINLRGELEAYDAHETQTLRKRVAYTDF
ncbi:hypothetical protein UFOVP469_11 [uncultured Caudovirales phage]|uniref:Uncharacterized protein n=1 Tax=uncultured Caudovirales phage TaxID=2100421 RepID=A0A6J5MKM2_9CAUD|nr:hypothetical protein UFOVP469_11 [uncultured Caudovirales phage]CAB4190162.1 hypothetical protein UFOVP1200_41 [uncultured Caudovirales phage]